MPSVHVGPGPESPERTETPAENGSDVLRSRVAALTRTLRERDRTIGTLLRQLGEGRQEIAGPAAGEGDASRETAELREQNRILKEGLQRLQNAEKLISIGKLAAGIAHELNTPIQYVKDNFTFLERAFKVLTDALDERTGAAAPANAAELAYLRQDLPEAIAQSREGLERIAAIVVAMKRFSHPSNGMMAPADLHEIIETTIALTRNEWKYVAEMATEFDPRVAEVPCIRDDIGKVVLNLIVNAAHAVGDANRSSGRDRGSIRVSTRLLEDSVEMVIADSGAGIPPHVQAHIFDPFFTTKTVGVGTGQGLAIVRSCVVEHHHGEIFFESEFGKGTAFHVRLPLRQPGEAA